MECRVASAFWSRFIGYMGRSPLPRPEGLLIRPCNSIHMFFMRFAIDALFLDEHFVVLRLFRALKPGQVVAPVKGAYQVVELPSETTPGSFTVGAKLMLEEI